MSICWLSQHFPSTLTQTSVGPVTFAMRAELHPLPACRRAGRGAAAGGGGGVHVSSYQSGKSGRGGVCAFSSVMAGKSNQLMMA